MMPLSSDALRPSPAIPEHVTDHHDSSVPDEVLVSRLGSRDEAAFAELYDRFAPRLLALALAVLKDRGEAEDVVQESFLFFWNKAGQFDPSRGKAFTWAALTVRHRAIDRLRALARRHPERLEGYAENQLADVHPAAPDIALADRERHQQAISLLDRLPQQQRQMLGLAFLQGLNHGEISRRLELPLGTVKTAIRRGLQRLRTSSEPSPEDQS